MATYVLVSLAGGVLFGILDAAINANRLARRLFEPCKPIARSALNPGVSFAAVAWFFRVVM